MVGHTQASASDMPQILRERLNATAPPAVHHPTPRKSRNSAANSNVPEARPHIVDAMDGEFVVCNIADWLSHYLPSFNADEDIKHIRKELSAKNILKSDQTAARTDARQQAIGEGSTEGNAWGRAGSREAEGQGSGAKDTEASQAQGDEDGESVVSTSDPEDNDYHEEGQNAQEKRRDAEEKEQPANGQEKQTVPPRRSARLGAKRPAAQEVPDEKGPVDDGTNVPYRWVKYPCQPSKISTTENTVFAPLRPIIQTIAAISGRISGEKLLKVEICPNTTLESDIRGSTNKIDGCLMFGLSTHRARTIHTSDIVLSMEFKRFIQDQAQNRAQCLSAGNQIMNDDPRRMFTFGMTIEDDKVSLWYFSRSHSAMSHAFSFVDDPDQFIRVILAFFRASDEQLGLDPLIKRCVPAPAPTPPPPVEVNKKPKNLKRKSRTSTRPPGASEVIVEDSTPTAEPSAPSDSVASASSHQANIAADTTSTKAGFYYIYALPQGGHKYHYYRTMRCIAEYRNLCITGRMTRVWEVVRVRSADDHTEIGERVVLKDVWLDEDADTEHKIQGVIIEALGDFFSSSDSPWKTDPRMNDVDGDIVARLEQLSQGGYKEYFLTIEDHYVGKISKETAPNSVPTRGLFDIRKTETSKSRTSKVTGRAPGTPQDKLPSQLPEPIIQRTYKPKKQYRVVFKEICSALDELPTLGEAVDAMADATIALQLMFCVGWVHRDISTGNILAHKENDKWKAKLSDLEYARRYPPDHTPAHDPKTGTAYFIPWEVASGYPLFIRPSQTRAPVSLKHRSGDIPEAKSKLPPVIHNFQHDLEALWWILIWTVTDNLAGDPIPEAQAFVSQVFISTIVEWGPRRRALQNPLKAVLRPCMPPIIADIFAHAIDSMRYGLDQGYMQREVDGNLTDPSSYSWVYNYFHSSFEYLQEAAKESPAWRDVRLKGKEPDTLPPPPPLTRAKRRASQPLGDSDNVEGSQPKRVKAD